MKTLIAILSLFALVSAGVAPYAQAGEINKQPLKLEQMVELQEQQAADFEEVKDTEAGIKNGYGMMGLALGILIGYVVYDQISDDDDD